MVAKNSKFKNNSRMILKKGIFSRTFPEPKKIQNNSRYSRNSRTTGHPETIFGITCIPQFFYSTIPAPPAPQTKGSSQLSRKFPSPLAPSKAKFETFQLSPVSIGGGRGNERGYKGSHYGSLWALQPMRNLDEIFNIFWLSVYM